MTGTTGAASNEFVELVNTGTAALDVSGYKLAYRSGAGTSDVTLATIPSGTSIPAGGFYLFGGSAYAGSIAPDQSFSTALAATAGGLAVRDASGAIVDSVSRYLDGLVRDVGLPQKVLVVHQLNPRIVTGWEALRRRDGVVVVKSVDGIGKAPEKITTWKRLVTRLPSTLHPGFKLFFDEDTEGGLSLMTPSQVLALRPQPEYVLYE